MIEHRYAGSCPDALQPDRADPWCPACRERLATDRLIAAGDALAREANPSLGWWVEWRVVPAMYAWREDRCECHPRPTGVNFVMDERSIIFCPICAGIEAGQATEADYHVTPFDDGRDTPQEVSATVLLKRARAAKREALGLREAA